jgi:hypothetical protein
MQTTHHPPTPHTILTTHAPPTSSLYQSLALHVNVEPQHNTFPIPLNNVHVGPFVPSILLALIVVHDQTSQLSPTLPTHLESSPTTFCPICGCQFILQGLIRHQQSCQTSNPSNLNLHDHLGPIPSFIPNLPALAWA